MSLLRLYFVCCSITWTKLFGRVDYDVCSMCKKRVDPWRSEIVTVDETKKGRGK